MASIVFGLAVIGFLVLFAYLKIPPSYADQKLVSVYNTMVLAVCFVFCLVFFLYIRVNLMGSINDKWWKPVAIAGSLSIEIVFLGVCFVLRNFWIFKPPRRPGRDGFNF
ncbi:MAG: hypothetical protein KAI61_04850 [Alphaproteobacteria bacterium]|nr:hypothetical protein [Alphaproteobacteria bacterium]MCK5518724.1 hypothetical protein [Alphaproteobacteria bacterium]MCK5554954.1 hypothetical protein [Alphaproteobacteria bacterium]